VGLLSGCSRPSVDVKVEGEGIAETAPISAVLQEMHDLLAEQTSLKLERRYLEQFTKEGSPENPQNKSELQQVEARYAETVSRLETIHRNELGQFERVADGAGLFCQEEPFYGQPSYGIVMYAFSTRDIAANELLLFHAGGVYRTAGTFRPLTTTGNGFYFRPNANIPKESRLVAACIQDAPEEIQNVKNGFMPDSNRARDPQRPYRTQVFGKDDKPIPLPDGG
jgi:hypothetical protein